MKYVEIIVIIILLLGAFSRAKSFAEDTQRMGKLARKMGIPGFQSVSIGWVVVVAIITVIVVYLISLYVK